MDIVTIQPYSGILHTIRPVPFLVFLNGRRRRDIYLERIVHSSGPDFDKAKVSIVMSAAGKVSGRLEDVDSIIRVGDRLTVCLVAAIPKVIFDGYIVIRKGQIDGKSERIIAEAEDIVSSSLNELVVGRWQQSKDAFGNSVATFMANGHCLFNGDNNGFASEEHFSINGKSTRIFKPGKNGQFWSVSDILQYLISVHVPSNVRTVGLEEFSSITEAIYPPEVDLTGLSVKEALCRAANLAGLAVRVAYSDRILPQACPKLVFYCPTNNYPRRIIHLQPAGENLDTRRSNVWKGSISVRRRAVKPRILLVGGLKRYEATFQLKPGWDSSAETGYYREFVRHESNNWVSVKDVFRKWVLNESGSYSNEPYNLERFDFSSINSEDFFLVRSRRFLPCLSTDLNGESLGIVVEVSFDSGSTWRQFPGAIRMLSDECGIYLADDALPVDYFQSALEHKVQLRVTATVQADRHISAETAGSSSCPAKVISVPSAGWAKVHSSSIFYNKEGLGQPLEQDDTARLERIAESMAKSQDFAVEADITLGWVEPTCRVGDVIERIEGREIELTRLPGWLPSITTIEHRCDENWSTHLKVSG